MRIAFEVDPSVMEACFGRAPHDPEKRISDDQWFDACARGRLEVYLSKHAPGPVLGEPTHQGLIDRATAAQSRLREDALAALREMLPAPTSDEEAREFETRAASLVRAACRAVVPYGSERAEGDPVKIAELIAENMDGG